MKKKTKETVVTRKKKKNTQSLAIHDIFFLPFLKSNKREKKKTGGRRKRGQIPAQSRRGREREGDAEQVNEKGNAVNSGENDFFSKGKIVRLYKHLRGGKFGEKWREGL